ncbi:hypothetical protein GCM10027594_00510 [Hymenobacter agri]|uniref:Uncharacterized protein n=1 Tax=Hymenobacter jeollabukensis TaxID=2025313 RepID=A0A5R8WI19_9BACT|nr:hypothetical protein [Hymenobacter jeollabukensis]TLM88502.1 hypothetical protein FDY95_24380 [Hymenobacter jeollabukensis]
MKNEWDFFADVQRRLAAGQQLVQGHFANPIIFPYDEQRGIVLDEDGNQYELGNDYKQALSEFLQQMHTPWGLCFRERLICFGQQVTASDYTADYVVAYEATTA